MTPDERRRVAGLRLRARRRREGELRRRAVLISAAVFAVLWVAVFAQLVSGHDPVLGRGTKTASVSRQTTQQQASQAAPSVSDETQAAPSPQPVAPSPAPVITSQS
jgi:lipase chaperone LimK